MALEDGTDEAFESGYAGDEAPAAKPTQSVADKPEEKPVETEASAPEATEAKTETEPAPEPELDLKAELQKLEKRTRNVEGHIGHLTASQRALQETMAAAAKQVSDAPTQKQLDQAIGDDAQVAELEKDYPEWAAAMRKISKENVVDIDEIKRKAVEEAVAVVAKQRFEEEMAELKDDFPGWEEEVSTDAFKSWIAKQPEDIKRLAASQKVKDARRLLTRFDEFKKTPPATKPNKVAKDTSRQERFAAAVTPKGSTGFKPGRTEEDEMMAGYGGL